MSALLLGLTLPSLARAEWQTSFGLTSSGWDPLSGVAVAPDGSPVGWGNAACGDSRGANAPELAWMSAADGSVAWRRTPSDASPYALFDCSGPPLFDKEGNVYAGGYPKGHYPASPSGPWDLVSYSRTGAFRWAAPIESYPANFILPDEAVGADGNIYVYVDGYYLGGPSYLHAFRASDGASLWSTEIPFGEAPGVGLYADQSGLILGGTMRFDYQGHLVPTSGQTSRGTRSSPIAQEPGGADYTTSANKVHCADKQPYYTVVITRWTLNGEDWKREVRPSAPPASREECETYVHVAEIRSAPGGGVVASYENGGNSAGHENVFLRLDAKGHVLWTHAIKPSWAFPSSAAFRVSSDGTIVAVEDGREPCNLNRWGECGVVAVNFLNAATGSSNRPTVFLRDTVYSYWNDPPNEPHLQGAFALGPESVYLYLAINEEYQVVKLDEPGLDADYEEALRAPEQNAGPAPVVRKVSPGRGSSGGGTLVSLKGHNLSGASTVRFGGYASPQVTVESDTSLTAIAPNGPAGDVDVTVTTPNGTSGGSKHDRFLYEPPAEYVALGDSFASGTGSFSYLSGTGSEGGCYRATGGYVEQLAGSTHETLAFAACNGATINDVVNGPVPQLDQLSGATKLVTLSVGGDDVGFRDVIASCIDAGPLYHGGFGCAQRDEPVASEAIDWLRNGHPAGTHTLPGINPETGKPESTTVAADLPSLEHLYESIAMRAPNARIFVVGYPLLFESGYPTPGDCEVAHPLIEVSGDDIGWLNANGAGIDTIIEGAAAAASAHTGHPITFVDPRALFEGHGLCDSRSAYINELLITKKKGKYASKQESFHPNVAGQNAFFTALEDAGA